MLNNNSTIKQYEITLMKQGNHQDPIFKGVHIVEFYMSLENIVNELKIGIVDQQPVDIGNSNPKWPSFRSDISQAQHEALREASDSGEFCNLHFGHLGIHVNALSIKQIEGVSQKNNELFDCPEQKWLLTIDTALKHGVMNGNTTLQNVANHFREYCYEQGHQTPKGALRFYVYLGVDTEQLPLLVEKLNSTADLSDYAIDNMTDNLNLIKASIEGNLECFTGKILQKEQSEILQASGSNQLIVKKTNKYPDKSVMWIQNDAERVSSSINPKIVLQSAHAWNIKQFPNINSNPTICVSNAGSCYKWYKDNTLPESTRAIAGIVGDVNFIRQYITARAFDWGRTIDQKIVIDFLIKNNLTLGSLAGSGTTIPEEERYRLTSTRFFEKKPKNGFSYNGKKKNYSFLSEDDKIIQSYKALSLKDRKEFQELVNTIGMVMTGALRVFLEVNENGMIYYKQNYSRNKIIELLECGLGHELLLTLLLETDMSVQSVVMRNEKGDVVTTQSIPTVTKMSKAWKLTYDVALQWFLKKNEKVAAWEPALSIVRKKATKVITSSPRPAAKVVRTLTANS
jgi:hypothetical protein